MLTETGVTLRLRIDGSDADADDLWRWMRIEPELRGHVRLEPGPPPAGAMGGGAAEIVVAAAASLNAVVMSVMAFLRHRESQRHADWRVRISAEGGADITVDRLRSPDELVRVIEASRDRGPAGS
ncbi:effector-associated constant component EACC1 [Dactylosporangium sp. CS-047395]|uniref:effector-associated constant component EACC1 n=1 Tax=Dactylosporangium sp. CS-047395 TaxID=3239936 RepID=UPI003D8AE7C6